MTGLGEMTWGEMGWGEMTRGEMGWGEMGWKLFPDEENDPGSIDDLECSHWPWCQHLRGFQMDLGGKSNLWIPWIPKVLSGTAIQQAGNSGYYSDTGVKESMFIFLGPVIRPHVERVAL